MIIFAAASSQVEAGQAIHRDGWISVANFKVESVRAAIACIVDELTKQCSPDAAPALFSHHRDDGPALDRTAPLAFFRAAHIGFVGLDLAGKAVAAGPHYGPPQLVQPGPGGP